MFPFRDLAAMATAVLIACLASGCGSDEVDRAALYRSVGESFTKAMDDANAGGLYEEDETAEVRGDDCFKPTGEAGFGCEYFQRHSEAILGEEGISRSYRVSVSEVLDGSPAGAEGARR